MWLVLVLLLAVPLAAAEPPAIPIRIENSTPLIEATVNGSEPLTFLLDSASGTIALDTAVAERLGLREVRAAVNTGTGGTVRSGVLKGVPIRVGGREFTPSEMRAFDFSGFTSAFSVPIHGILGEPFFQRFAVEIDYPKWTVRFLDPGKYPLKGKVLKLTGTTPPIIEGAIHLAEGERIPVRLEVDTGSANLLILAAPFIRKHRLFRGTQDFEIVKGHGVGGSSEALRGTVGKLEVGGITINEPDTIFTEDEDGLWAMGYRDGNLGGRFLAGFKVTFDFRNSRFLLDPGQ